MQTVATPKKAAIDSKAFGTIMVAAQGIALAMEIAVFVLSLLQKIEPHAAA